MKIAEKLDEVVRNKTMVHIRAHRLELIGGVVHGCCTPGVGYQFSGKNATVDFDLDQVHDIIGSTIWLNMSWPGVGPESMEDKPWGRMKNGDD